MRVSNERADWSPAASGCSGAWLDAVAGRGQLIGCRHLRPRARSPESPWLFQLSSRPRVAVDRMFYRKSCSGSVEPLRFSFDETRAGWLRRHSNSTSFCTRLSEVGALTWCRICGDMRPVVLDFWLCSVALFSLFFWGSGRGCLCADERNYSFYRLPASSPVPRKFNELLASYRVPPGPQQKQ